MGFLDKIFNRSDKDKDKLAQLLNVNKEALTAFDEAYKKANITNGLPKNFFDISAKEAALVREEYNNGAIDMDLVNRIVGELLSSTKRWVYDGKTSRTEDCLPLLPAVTTPVTNEEIKKLPLAARPQLTGHLMLTDLGGEPSYVALLSYYKSYLENKGTRKGRNFYHLFRQGLDLLDLDDITYQVIGTNPVSIGYWLPKMVAPMTAEGFFKIPKTTVIKVPMPVLQMTRLDYGRLTPATMAIVNKFCHEAFKLQDNLEYFIKTGTYSSKFEFRNAHITGAKEVQEIGEYLLFIHHQALCRAQYDLSALNQPICYGVSTTNEWCVREFIKDKDGRPTIYNGMPLHTEYRVFVDFDLKTVLGIHPYWDPKVMKDRFDNYEDADTPKMIHDAVTYRMCEHILMEQFESNKDKVCEHLQKVVASTTGMTGQWSIDIMQNGDDFWFIDMATADRSAFYTETVPVSLRKRSEENWLPSNLNILLEGGSK